VTEAAPPMRAHDHEIGLHHLVGSLWMSFTMTHRRANAVVREGMGFS
jgi:hypothetical protein